MPKRVAIIITVYKRTDLLGEALASALAQTYPETEVIVADDSGTAAASAICAPHAAANRIRYVANPQTLGIVGSLRSALEKTQGAYVAILNDDDLWEPDFLATLVPALEADPRRVLAFCDHWVIRDGGEIDHEETGLNTGRYGRAELGEGDVPDAASLVLHKNGVPLAMGSVFRKDALDPALLRPEVSGAYDLWVSCVLAGLRRPFYYTPKRLTRYRVHGRSETARRSHDRCANLVFIFSQLIERRWFPEHDGYLRARLGAAQYHLGRDKLYFNRLAEARACFRSAWKNHRDWRPATAFFLSFLPSTARCRLKLSIRET